MRVLEYFNGSKFLLTFYALLCQSGLLLDEKEQLRTIDKRQDFASMFKFPPHLMRNKHVEINDVVKEHVLPFLPAKSLARFRTVSKEWDQWIAGPFLALKQSYLFRNASGFFCQYSDSTPTFITFDPSAYGIPRPSLEFLPEPVEIRSSHNGLLLCQGLSGENAYYICNPANEEWRLLPRPDCYHGSEPAVVLSFEPSELNIAAHFKVVCAFPSIDGPMIEFEIYSSEKRSWRCSAEAFVFGEYSAETCFEPGGSTLKGGFCMNRMAYWETSSGANRAILAFDMKNELCGSIPLPSGCKENGVLTQMHGELCYIQAFKRNGNVCDINIYQGMDMSLKQSIAIHLGGVEVPDFRALPSVNSDVVMILCGRELYSYHLRDQTVELVSMEGYFGRRYFPYVNSLVSLAPEQ